MDPTGTQLTLWLAFAAGVLSLISPCVLALVPAYITYISGAGVANANISAKGGARPASEPRIIVHAAMFSLGFTAVFVAFGASASLLGRLLIANQLLVAKVAGVLVAGFGLHTLGLLRIPGFDADRRLRYRNASGKYHQSILVGMAFAAGWTPCVGPILGGILAVASVGGTLWHGVVLLLCYALGMAIPFLLIAGSMGRSTRIVQAIKRRHRLVEIASGVLLVAIGIMLYTDTFSALARYFNYLAIL